MSFLSVLFAYLLSRYTSLATWIQHDGWFDLGLTSLVAKGLTGRIPFYVIVFGTSLLCLFVIRHLSFGLDFFATIALLLYSLGRGNWRDYLSQTFQALQNGKAQTVWLTLESEGNIEATGGDALWMAIRKHAAYSYLRDLFAVFFWFCLAGPAGAVFFRLLTLYNQHASVRNTQLPSFLNWQTALEWLPARYMGLCFCLAGDFSRCFRLWRKLVLDTQLDSRTFLCRCLDEALVMSDNTETPATSLEQELVDKSLRYGVSIQDLLIRSEMIGLVGLALTVIIFH